MNEESKASPLATVSTESTPSENAPLDAQEVFISRFRTKALDPSGFVLFPFPMYLEEPLFFFQQILCFFRGHYMEREEIGSRPGEPAPIAVYACKTCGQMLDMKLESEDIRTYSKNGMVNFPGE